VATAASRHGAARCCGASGSLSACLPVYCTILVYALVCARSCRGNDALLSNLGIYIFVNEDVNKRFWQVTRHFTFHRCPHDELI
jgi:hypothetical protein